MPRSSHAVLIGRFQPPHSAHLKLLRRALDVADRVIVVLGSHRGARTVKNPWSAAEREAMLRACLTSGENARVAVEPVRDYLYNDALWLADLQQKVRMAAEGDCETPTFALVGHYKDRSSYYLRLFPRWRFDEVRFQRHEVLSATDIRNAYFTGGDAWRANCPPAVVAELDRFKQEPTFAALAEEWAFLDGYRKTWASAPFPPTFVTVDAVVVCSGHVLVVRRRATPGKGLIALPGGFVHQDEALEDAALRELREETGLRVPIEEVRPRIRDRAVFDHPDRSLRGRTVTHAYFIRLDDGALPSVKGDDDADKAWWMPLGDVYLNEDRFFEDHLHIITRFMAASA